MWDFRETATLVAVCKLWHESLEPLLYSSLVLADELENGHEYPEPYTCKCTTNSSAIELNRTIQHTKRVKVSICDPVMLEDLLPAMSKIGMKQDAWTGVRELGIFTIFGLWSEPPPDDQPVARLVDPLGNYTTKHMPNLTVVSYSKYTSYSSIGTVVTHLITAYIECLTTLEINHIFPSFDSMNAAKNATVPQINADAVRDVAAFPESFLTQLQSLHVYDIDDDSLWRKFVPQDTLD